MTEGPEALHKSGFEAAEPYTCRMQLQQKGGRDNSLI